MKHCRVYRVKAWFRSSDAPSTQKTHVRCLSGTQKTSIAAHYLPNKVQMPLFKPNRLSRIWSQLIFSTLSLIFLLNGPGKLDCFPLSIHMPLFSATNTLATRLLLPRMSFFSSAYVKVLLIPCVQLKCHLFYEAFLDAMQLEIILHIRIPWTWSIFLPWNLKQSTFHYSFLYKHHFLSSRL